MGGANTSLSGQEEDQKTMSAASLSELLVETLERLDEEQFRLFKESLMDPDIMEDIPVLPGSRLTERVDPKWTVALMMDAYSVTALEVTKQVLRKLNENDLLTRLTSSSSGLEDSSPGREDLPNHWLDCYTAKQRLFTARPGFSQRVSEPVLKTLLDELLQQGVLSPEEMESALAQTNKTDKARAVIDMVRNKGEDASSIMITVLCKEDRFLSKDLLLTELRKQRR